MPRASSSVSILPDAAVTQLIALGRNLRVARERRGETLRQASLRMNASVPTIRRMETGDPKVGIGVYATALWLYGMIDDLGEIGDPRKDEAALSLDIMRSDRRRK